MAPVVFLTVAFLIYEAQSQICGPGSIFPGQFGLDSGYYGPIDNFGFIPGGIPPQICPGQPCGPIINSLPSFTPNQLSPCPNIVSQPLIPPCPQVIIPECPVVPSIITNTAPCTSVAAPPVVATIVDNTLANSLANAIQLLIVSNLIENTLGSPCSASVAQSLGLLDIPCANNFEIVTPDFLYPAQTVICESPGFDYACFNEVPYYQEPVYACDCSVPYAFDNAIQYFDYGVNPVCGYDPCVNPFSRGVFGQSVPCNYGCAEPVYATVAPVAVEVPFPGSIPAQLLCSFGYMPTATPCVSVNVEPLPFDGCNLFGNNYFY